MKEIFADDLEISKSMVFFNTTNTIQFPPLTFLNVDIVSYTHAYFAILLVKAIVAGYASKYLVPFWFTAIIFFFSILNVLYIPEEFFTPEDGVLFHFTVLGSNAVLILSPINDYLVLISWIFVAFDIYFQYFLDIYFITSLILYLFKLLSI